MGRMKNQDWDIVIQYVYEQAIIANAIGIDKQTFPKWLKKKQWDDRIAIGEDSDKNKGIV